MMRANRRAAIDVLVHHSPIAGSRALGGKNFMLGAAPI